MNRRAAATLRNTVNASLATVNPKMPITLPEQFGNKTNRASRLNLNQKVFSNGPYTLRNNILNGTRRLENARRRFKNAEKKPGAGVRLTLAPSTLPPITLSKRY